MKDCEITVTVDLDKFPKEYWTGDSRNPYMRVDEHQLNDMANWVSDQLPKHDEICVELAGRCPAPFLLLIGCVLRDNNCKKLVYVKPGWQAMTIWDDMEAGQ